MSNYRWTLAALVLLFTALPVANANRHEHFYSWLTPESFIEAYPKVFKTDFKDLALASILGTSSPSLENLTLLFGSQLAQSLEPAITNNPSITVGEIALTVSGLRNIKFYDALKNFLELDSRVETPLNAYRQIEDIRKNIIKGAKRQDPAKYAQLIRLLFDKTLDQIPKKDRQVIAISVPGELFDDQLKELSKLMETQGTRSHFYFSYPRYKLRSDSETVFQEKMEQLRKGIRGGWAHGIDVTGEIRDGHSATSELRPIYESRLLALAQTTAECPECVFKVHAFETTHQGAFYDALWNVLETLDHSAPKKTPGLIDIAHIAALTDADIEHFSRLSQLRFAFDANLYSNLVLHGKWFADSAKIIEKLQSKGFHVGVGSDGYGILGEKSSVTNALQLIRSTTAQAITDVEKTTSTLPGEEKPCSGYLK